MTDADTTKTQTTTYVVQFVGVVSRKWVDAAVEPFDDLDDALDWIAMEIPAHASRILKRTVLVDVVAEREVVA